MMRRYRRIIELITIPVLVIALLHEAIAFIVSRWGVK